MKFFSPLLLSSLSLASTLVKAQTDSIVQTYFIPFPEQSLLETFVRIQSAAVSPVNSLISIAVATDGTKIFYDHWEDGFDPDSNSPDRAGPSPTEIWGDGDPSNGAPPGHPTDILNGGDVIILENQVPADPRGTATYFDGGDRVSVTLPIAITRGAYPEGAGSLMAGAVEVFDVSSWGTTHISPVGDKLGETDPFEVSL